MDCKREGGGGERKEEIEEIEKIFLRTVDTTNRGYTADNEAIGASRDLIWQTDERNIIIDAHHPPFPQLNGIIKKFITLVS